MDLSFRKLKNHLQTSDTFLKLYRKAFQGFQKPKNIHEFDKSINKSSKPNISRNLSVKSPMRENFFNNHISLNRDTKILDLPKTPYGVHLTYNEDINFLNHFQGENVKLLKKYEKNKKLLEKEIKSVRKLSKNFATKIVKEKQEMFIYKTSGGELYCKSDKNLIQTYEQKGNSFDKSISSNNLNKPLKNFMMIEAKINRLLRNPSPF